jgi:hypothetical protein
VRPGTDGAVAVQIPHTPLSPGEKRSFSYEVDVPLVGTVRYENTLVTEPGDDTLCSLPQVNCD